MAFGLSHVVEDSERQRSIPVEIYEPQRVCSTDNQCPVAIINPGYRVTHTGYVFLADVLNELGFLVVAVRHELSGDPVLSREGNLYQTRRENWVRGAKNLRVVIQDLGSRLPGADFRQVTLIGHSNGGDIASWYVKEKGDGVITLITLDHRRVPLPRAKDIAVLSIRADDFVADKGVLPDQSEQQQYGDCVVKIPDSRHNDMSDDGPEWLHQKVRDVLRSYLQKNARCDMLKSIVTG